MRYFVILWTADNDVQASDQIGCVPIQQLSNQPSWISWCNTNCGNPPGSHPACNGQGAHVKCKCGRTSCNIFTNIQNKIQCLILSNTHCSFLLKYLFINGECLAVCNTQLSRHALRCGSRWGGRCNKNLMHYALYCKVETGWCSRRPKNKSPDRDDSFDWEPASCKGNLITP